MYFDLNVGNLAEPISGRSWTRQEIPGQVARRVARFQRHGLLRGDRVFLPFGNSLEFFAELLAMKAQHRMDGRPEELVRQALAIDPEHPSALMMSGVVAYQRSDFDGAVRDWEKLLALLEPGSEDAKMTQENLDDARAQSALTKAQKNRP